VAFARPLGAEIKILHLSRPNEVVPDDKTVNGQLKDRSCKTMDLEIDESRAGQSLLANMQRHIRRLRPSLIVMFTNQHRNFFQRITFPSKTEKVSFTTRIPLLSFHKD
jgi:hypothetical protein